MNTNTAHPRLYGHGLASLTVRAKASLGGRGLDRRLLAGEAPGDDPALTRRARKLLERDHRHGVAMALRETMQASLRPEHQPSSKISLNRAEIQRARDELLELIALLDGAAPVSVRGVILSRRLLSDPASPLFANAPDGALSEAARHARSALLLG